MISELIATLASGLFTGAAVYINLVEHPARMSCGIEVALAEFRPSYRRASIMQGLLAVVAAAAGFIAWATGRGSSWALGASVMAAVIPFTLFVIFPTNKLLLSPAAGGDIPIAIALLTRWNHLHAVRSVLGLAAFVVFVVLLGG